VTVAGLMSSQGGESNITGAITANSNDKKLKLIDWKKSLIKKNLDNGKTEFNAKSDPRAMKED